MGKRQRRRLRETAVAESAGTMATANRTTITEARSTAPVLTGERMLIRLINPGWGSSGYYSASVLAAAAESKVFPSGLHMYMDHPTATEDYDRPERSVKDLAAVLTEDARVQDGALVAEARVFSPYRTVLTEAADDIGVSIRAYAEAVDGEAEGRKGTLITRLTEGISVDFVTHAGRGGKILSVLESTRGTAREAHGMTANDLRAALRSVVSDTHATGEREWAWVRDYTDDWVVFELTTADKEALYQQTYTVDAGKVTLTGDPVEVYAHTMFIPVGTLPPPAPDPVLPTESAPITDAAARILAEVRRSLETTETSTTQGGPPPETTTEEGAQSMGDNQTGTKSVDSGGTQASESATRPVSEAEVLARRLAEANAQVAEETRRREAAEKRADEAERRATLVEAKWAAEKKTLEALRTSPLKEASWPAVISAVTDGIVLDDKGKVDESKLADAITAAIEAERGRVAALLEAHGVGVPRDLGGGTTAESDVPEVDLEAELRDFGLSESMAKGAASAGKGV